MYFNIAKIEIIRFSWQYIGLRDSDEMSIERKHLTKK